MNRAHVAVLILGMAVPATAQAPAGDVSAGWSLLHALDAPDEEANFPVGFMVGGAGRLTDSIGIAGELGWNRKTETFLDFEASLTFTTFAAGPRFYFGDRVTGFAHVLFGGIRAKVTGSSPFGEESLSENEFMIQPGAGFDIRMGNSFAVRLQGDYQWINVEDSDGNLRFVLGGVLYFGQR